VLSLDISGRSLTRMMCLFTFNNFIILRINLQWWFMFVGEIVLIMDAYRRDSLRSAARERTRGWEARFERVVLDPPCVSGLA
jgi:hypothetical protein